MQRIVRRTGLVLVMATLALAASAAMAGDAEDVKAALEKSIDLFNDRQEAYFDYIHDDYEGFAGVGSPLLYKGKKVWTEFIHGMWNDNAMVQYLQRTDSIRVYGNTAVVSGYHDFTVHTKDGQVALANGRTTAVMVKQDGMWKVVTFHFSDYF